MKSRVVVVALLACPAAWAEAVNLNGQPVDVTVTKAEKLRSIGTLNNPTTIEVQGNKLELKVGGELTWNSKGLIETASLARETPVKLAGHDFVLQAGSQVEINNSSAGARIRSCKIAKDAEVRLEGRPAMVAKAIDQKWNLQLDTFKDRVARFYTAQELQVGVVNAAPLTMVEVPGGVTSLSLEGTKLLEVSVFGKPTQATRASFDGDKLMTAELYQFVDIGGRKVPVWRIDYAEDGSIKWLTTASINGDTGGFKKGTKLFVAADGSAFSENAADLPKTAAPAAAPAAPAAAPAPTAAAAAPAPAAEAAPAAQPAATPPPSSEGLSGGRKKRIFMKK